MSTFNGLVAEFPDIRGKPGPDLFLGTLDGTSGITSLTLTTRS